MLETGSSSVNICLDTEFPPISVSRDSVDLFNGSKRVCVILEDSQQFQGKAVRFDYIIETAI
jgi:hypothetical protein